MTPEQLASRLAVVASQFKPATELLRAVGRVVHVKVKEQIRRRAYKTGRLHGSGVERVVGDSFSLEFTAPYAVFQNDGTRYMDGKHFMEHGLDAAMPDVERELREFGENALGKVAG